jgi:hypothetical protein
MKRNKEKNNGNTFAGCEKSEYKRKIQADSSIEQVKRMRNGSLFRSEATY